MIQLLFGFNTDLSKPSVVMNALRSIFMTIDHVIYWCIGVVYNILFNISDATIVSSSLLKDFYGRVQLILGIIMIFKISVSLLQYIINPDSFSDKKVGFSQVITRIIIMLAMLTAIIPLNIPITSTDEENKTYNYYLNQNGLLFGTMFSLQHRILKQNTIAKLILGNNENSFVVKDQDDKEIETGLNESSEAGSAVATYVFKSFFRINTKDNIDKDNIDDSDTYFCGASENVKDGNNIIKTAQAVGTTATGAAIGTAICPGFGTIIGGVTGFAVNKIFTWATSENSGEYYREWLNSTQISTLSEMVNVNCGDYYLFSYLPIVSTICGILLLLVFAVTCLDVAIRTLKLAVLRLIAPIAIISYIDPKSSEKGAFGSWIKLLISTYIDLFIRLAIIYFVVFIAIEIVAKGGLSFAGNGNVAVNLLSNVIIIIGLFYFAKQAPKFISDALGLKGLGVGVGLSGLLSATGALLGGAGLSGATAGFMSGSNQANEAAATGKQAPPSLQMGSDLAAQLRTGDTKSKGGILNNAQDYMARQAGIRMASRYGVTNSKLEADKGNMYAWGDEVAIRDNMEKRGWDNLTNDEKSKVEAFYRKKNNITGNLNANQTAQMHAEGATMYANDAKTNYNKAKSNYDKAQKFADTHRVSTSFEEEFRPSIKERFSNYSAIRTNPGDIRGQHQGIQDRVVGTNNWDVYPNRPGEENLNANNIRDEGNNNYNDNPDRFSGPVGTNGGPPGGPPPV